MTEYVEFYIACNPPLLPQGVSEVIRRVQESEGLLELLYEPDVPWFKCIALATQKAQITANVQDNLFAIADEDVDAFDGEQQTDGDVTIISPDSRMTSWSAYQAKGGGAYTFADADVFPEPIAEAKYKTTWRGLEAYPPATFESLLLRCHTYGDNTIPREHDKFEAVVRCQISYNTRQTLLYVGCDTSRQILNTTIEILDKMVQVYNRNWEGNLPTLPSICEAAPAVVTSHTPISDDPFGLIPAAVNANLQSSMVPWSTGYNDGSLI
ncbi:hypothetical protein PWT90_04067 [Aphanocladium album]|nr:hypothetical protein PWT90_04067 [Aphanocladium album]